MAKRAGGAKLLAMSTTSFDFASFLALTLVAGLLMVYAGVGKKRLSWKAAHRRCPTCGRDRRFDCRCRR